MNKRKELENYLKNVVNKKCNEDNVQFSILDIKDAFITGWDKSKESFWITPDKIENCPEYSKLQKNGFIALLSNGLIQCQRDLRGFNWLEKDKKFVFNYTEVIAWMYLPSFNYKKDDK